LTCELYAVKRILSTYL